MFFLRYFERKVFLAEAPDNQGKIAKDGYFRSHRAWMPFDSDPDASHPPLLLRKPPSKYSRKNTPCHPRSRRLMQPRRHPLLQPAPFPSNHLILPMQLRLFIPIHKLFPQINNFLRELYRMDNRKNRNYFAEP